MWSNFNLIRLDPTSASPWTTVTSSGGKIEVINSSINFDVLLVNSEGFKTTQLPAAIAETNGFKVKLKG